MKKLFFVIALLTIFAIPGFSQSHIDVVYLKNGSVIRGLVVEQIPGETVTIETYDGSVFVYNMDEVERIIKERNVRRRRVGQEPTNSYDDYYKKTLRGYKGFVDAGYSFGDYESVQISTSHGFQFNNYIFVGGGMGYNYYSDWELSTVPVFANFRANFINNRITPFADVKAGYTIGDIEGGHASVGLGLRVGLQNKMALNFMVTYYYQDDEYYDDWDGHYYYSGFDTEGIGIKIGFEF